MHNHSHHHTHDHSHNQKPCINDPYHQMRLRRGLRMIQIIAFLFLVGYLLFNLISMLLVLLPNSKSTDGYEWVVVAFSIAQIVLNYYRLCTNSNIVSPIVDKGLQNKQWSYCVRCKIMRPPRAHHCAACETCILKRDHHCYFAFTCVGMNNFRYFFLLLFYILLFSLYTFLHFISYASQEYRKELKQVTDYPILTFIFPPWSLILVLTGELPFIVFYYNVCSCICSLFSACATFYLGWGLTVLLDGQTSSEALQGEKKYHLGMYRNIKEVFGSYPFVNFIFPFKSRLNSDGYDFELNPIHREVSLL